MKKLHVNIEEIKIKGRPSVLAQPVIDIDRRMQTLATATEEIKSIMYKFSGTNQGKQYNKACNAVTKLSSQLFEASETLNDVQQQIVLFANKGSRYEQDSSMLGSPRKHNVKKAKVSVNTSEIEFHKDEMILVRDRLEKYSRSAKEENKKLRSNRDAIGRIWSDRQYKDFSKYIDDVSSEIETGCKELDEYSAFLTGQIKDLT